MELYVNPCTLNNSRPQDILNVTKASLYNNLKRSLSRYMEISRPEWLMHKNPTSGEISFGVGDVLLPGLSYRRRWRLNMIDLSSRMVCHSHQMILLSFLERAGGRFLNVLRVQNFN